MTEEMGQAFEQVFGRGEMASPAMRRALATWFGLYFGAGGVAGGGALGEGGTGGMGAAVSGYAGRLAYVVVSGLCRACFGEYEQVVAPGAPPAFVRSMQRLDARRAEALQMAMVGGEAFLKPVPVAGGFDFVVVRRSACCVLGRGPLGEVTALGTWEKSVEDAKHYTLLELREVDSEGLCSMHNRLFESRNEAVLGRQVPLATLTRYAALSRETRKLNFGGGLGLVRLCTPMANCVDGSAAPVSVYAAAVEEMAAAGRHALRCEEEYELTRPRLVASGDVLRRDKHGEFCGVPSYIEALDGDGAGVDLTLYNPAPHQAQLEARENQLLRHIEDICSLRRGMLSAVESEDRTATEVLASSGRYALLIREMQGMWQAAVHDVVALLDVLGPMYGYWTGPAPQVGLRWGNGVLYDEERDWQRIKAAVEAGHLRAEYVPAWLFDEAVRSEEDLARVRARYMP